MLKELIKNNLKIELSKTQIFKQKIEFLGFEINKYGYSRSNKNLPIVYSLVKPKYKNGVKSLLGLYNYFRTLINNYAEIVNPLVELTKGNRNFKWIDETE